MAIDRLTALKKWNGLSEDEQRKIVETENLELAKRRAAYSERPSRLRSLLESERLRKRLRRTSDQRSIQAIRDRLREIEASLAKQRKQDAEKRIVAPRYFRETQTTIRELIGPATIYGAFVKLIEQAQTSPCPNPSVQAFSIQATDFHEYRFFDQVMYPAHWGPNYVGADWYLFPGAPGTAPSAATIQACQWVSFNVFAFSSPNPWDYFSDFNIAGSAGVLKFVLPAQPCRSTVDWAVVPIIDLIMGATIDADDGFLILDYVVRAQPASTAFPADASFEESFEFVNTNPRIWYDADEIAGFSWQRVTEQHLITGSYEVAAGVQSSVLVGPAGTAMVLDGKACVGDCTNNHDLDGRLKFAWPFCGFEPGSPMAGMCEMSPPTMTFVVTPL